MSRAIPRSWRAAALLVATLLLAPAVPAAADPVPAAGPQVSGVLVPGVLVPAGGSAGGAPVGEDALDRLAKDVEDARHAAEAAEQRYTAAAGQLTDRRAAAGAATAQAETERGRVAEAETEAARMVGAQYRSGGLGPLARLFLADRPQDVLDRRQQDGSHDRSAANVLRELQDARNRLVLAAEQARQAEQSAAATAADAQRALDEAKALAARTEQLLASATAEQLALLEQREGALADRAREQLLAAGAFGPDGEASPAGRKAIEFALAQRGKPYLWGGTGPDAFDCSGLTSQAWRAAGLSIPRTSQEQWAGLHRVALRDLRPGDLIIYHADAGHVALYLGGGTVVHAPHTGTVVKLAPITMLPILGAVRPDA
ncbi:NlpC/P60 family protein [Kitasatospora sp. NPDC088134]|uniref:C40 family peptidase n=1 Tax=Kitasatospora sp. NPDC088134 TaxID=3364071 RepID=UPI0037F2D12C